MAERGSPQWKMNIGKANSHLVEPEQTLCCPYCKGEGWIQNPGWELRLRREQAGLTQKEFVKQSCYERTTIQLVERCLRRPPQILIEEYRKLPRVNNY